jgi:hypothetical protein
MDMHILMGDAGVKMMLGIDADEQVDSLPTEKTESTSEVEEKDELGEHGKSLSSSSSDAM